MEDYSALNSNKIYLKCPDRVKDEQFLWGIPSFKICVTEY